MEVDRFTHQKSDKTFFVFSLQAKLLFSDGEKVIPRLTHELPGIKVRVPVCWCFAGRTDQTGRLESSVALRRLHGPPPVCGTRSE